MADVEMLEPNTDDLEDGEIESDSEQQHDEDLALPPAEEAAPAVSSLQSNEFSDTSERKLSKSESKREKKKLKEQQKNERDFRPQKKDKVRKFLLPTPVEDDFAGNIEKAIRMALKGKDHHGDNPLDGERFDSGIDDLEAKRKHKKRKKHGQFDKESFKKRKKREESRIKGDEEMDEDEMMCIRGASPVFKQTSQIEEYANYPSEEDYDSEGSQEHEHERGGRGARQGRGGGRERRPERPRLRARRQDMHPQQDPDGVCLFFMQGKCYKGEECTFSHDAHPPRKMELCKFYLKDCCAKRDKCLYLHSDFPCKYYHTGLNCVLKEDCKFSHGKPLSDSLKNILLKHIESAPKEILGDFPRLSREAATMMVANFQNKLMQQYSPNKSNFKDKSIPSIFELNVPKPSNYDESQVMNSNEISMLGDKNKNFSKVRQSRWCDNKNQSTPLLNTPSSNNPNATLNVLNIHNLNGVLTQTQISELVNLGIDNLNQLSQLTVIQLNQLGLTMNQINEIQLNTMSIQKLGLIHNQSSNPNLNNVKINKDLDMRVSPILPDLKPNPANTEATGQDVDMRYQRNALHQPSMSDKDSRSFESFQTDPRKQKSSIDIDQYTKDALKFSAISKENTDGSDNELGESNIPESKKDIDIDHRLLQYVQDATTASISLSQENDAKSDFDTDIRSSKGPEMYAHKKQEQKVRRTTTDDEEDSLQIDEKWYSSDEERNDKSVSKIKSPPQVDIPKVYTPTPSSDLVEPCHVITKLGDLSKIDISAEVTKLLSTIKNSTPAEQIVEPVKKDIPKSRDPRSMKKSPEHKSSSEIVKKTAPKPGFVSIYNCVEGGSSDGRKRTDIDLRPIKDIDFRIPSFGDTDLRQTPGSGDVDLRLGLPFKPIPNYTPASEIDGSINSHPPITFKLSLVDVPRPDYTDIKNSTPKSQATSDPRLRKIFRLSVDEIPLELVEKPAKASGVARIDPRKRTQESSEKPNSSKPPPLDLQGTIQSSNWYKELGSNQKILVNQQLAPVTLNLKKFLQDNAPGKLFDLSGIKSNSLLTSVFTNSGVMINEKGEVSQMKVPDVNPSIMSPMNFNQNENFPGNMGIMDSVGMMGLNQMGPAMGMGPPSMGPMSNFDLRFQGDPRSAPGLLGIAPNIPHNYESGNFNGMSNFNNDNSRMMPNFNNDNNSRSSNFNNDSFNSNFNDTSGMYNNSGSNMNEFRGENDDKYYRSQGKNEFKSYHGRGNRGDRWQRGSRGRDRRGYSERGGGGGGWKGDRR